MYGRVATQGWPIEEVFCVFICKPKEIGKTRSNKMLKKQQNKASPAEECHKCKNDPNSELQVKAATDLKAFLRGGLLMGRAGCKDSFAITITGQTLNCFHLCLLAIISYWRLSNLCTNINQAANGTSDIRLYILLARICICICICIIIWIGGKALL